MKKLNNKGFTIAEVMVSFSLISVILVSMITATMFYRDRIKEEEIASQLWDFKNYMTKIIYDDIIDNDLVKAEYCVGSSNCVNLYDANNSNPHTMKIVEYDTGDNKGVYLSYNNVKYFLPDSDLGTGNDRICDFVGGFDISGYNNELYKVKVSFRHKDMDIHHDLLFVIA